MKDCYYDLGLHFILLHDSSQSYIPKLRDRDVSTLTALKSLIDLGAQMLLPCAVCCAYFCPQLQRVLNPYSRMGDPLLKRDGRYGTLSLCKGSRARTLLPARTIPVYSPATGQAGLAHLQGQRTAGRIWIRF